MTAAGYLSRAGKRVIVVERSPKVGGMATSGYMIPEAPQHLVTPCAVELLFVRGTGVIEDLELGKHGRSEEHTSELQSLMRTAYAVFCLTHNKNTHNKLRRKK